MIKITNQISVVLKNKLVKKLDKKRKKDNISRSKIITKAIKYYLENEQIVKKAQDYNIKIFPMINEFEERNLTANYVRHQGYSKDLISFGYVLDHTGNIVIRAKITPSKKIEKNKLIFDKIIENKEEIKRIEQELGFKLELCRNDDMRMSTIQYNIKGDWYDRNTWSELIPKHTKLQNKFNRILQPYCSLIVNELRRIKKILD